jgi:hypothetical protein
MENLNLKVHGQAGEVEVIGKTSIVTEWSF